MTDTTRLQELGSPGFHSRLVVAESLTVMFLFIILVPVLSIPESKRLMIGHNNTVRTSLVRHFAFVRHKGQTYKVSDKNEYEYQYVEMISGGQD